MARIVAQRTCWRCWPAPTPITDDATTCVVETGPPTAAAPKTIIADDPD